MLSRTRQFLLECRGREGLVFRVGFFLAGLMLLLLSSSATWIRKSSLLEQNKGMARWNVIEADNEGNSTNLQPTSEEGNSTNSHPKRLVPNVLLVGTAKAGTSTTWTMLKDRVCHSQKKEIHFFDRGSQFYGEIEWYTNQFAHCASSDIILDATPGYLLHSSRIRKFYQSTWRHLSTTALDLKVVLILREPVSRELSWYNHKMDLCLHANRKSKQHMYGRRCQGQKKLDYLFVRRIH